MWAYHGFLFAWATKANDEALKIYVREASLDAETFERWLTLGTHRPGWTRSCWKRLRA